ncbi:hypothetical protein ABIE44_000584 [Marmoricola sp. OAE513]|uniref:hypothetical protein n=1 Tax=Marmoricola sp. OAE513 TaxID=2817894 RepID=UPI001AE9E1EF
MLDLTTYSVPGVFLRRHALELGYDDKWLARSVRNGTLVRVRHGAYVEASRWNDADESDRHALACHGVWMSRRSEIAFSHQSGAVLHGLRLWGTDLSRVHVSRFGVTAARKHQDVAYHDVDDRPTIHPVGGLSALSAARCAIGAASLSSVESGIVVADSAYHLAGCTPEQMRAAAAEMQGWPGTRRLQITLRLAQPGAESVGESRSRYLFWRHQIPRPELQYVVADGQDILGTTDFAWPEDGVLGEFDGKVKYGRYLRPGESPGDAVFREKRREDAIRELTGFRFVRLTWADLHDPMRTAARVHEVLRGRGATRAT